MNRMTFAFLADKEMKQEILQKGISDLADVYWPDSVSSLVMLDADCYFDLKFEVVPERINTLRKLLPRPVFINAVNDTLQTIGESRFVRINAWPGMMSGNLTEIVCSSQNKAMVENVFETAGWKFSMVADIPGMITPRIIASIINEAYFALDAGVSSKAEIDIAMKSGTNYPSGPFEWEEKIGRANILTLLKSLHHHKTGYDIAASLSDPIK